MSKILRNKFEIPFTNFIFAILPSQQMEWLKCVSSDLQMSNVDVCMEIMKEKG